MSDRCRPRKRHHFATPSLQSDMVDARDAAVGAIVAAAGGLAVGLAKLASSGWLASVPAFGMRGWQILSVGAFAVNEAVSTGTRTNPFNRLCRQSRQGNSEQPKQSEMDGFQTVIHFVFCFFSSKNKKSSRYLPQPGSRCH